MTYIQKVLVLTALSFIISACAKSENEMTGGQGPKIKDISPPPSGEVDPDANKILPQAVGFYAKGKIVNDFFFPLESGGLLKVFRGRARNYATNNLFNVVSYGAVEVAKRFPNGERLQVGDIAKKGGGQLALHDSHQNGLDADIAYYRVNRRELNPEGFGGFDELFVKNGKVTSNFDLERNYEIIKLFVSTGNINRIFMDAAIKTRFCQLAEGQPLTNLDKEALRRMRPLVNHQDHMHVRVKCPQTSPNCVTQVEPPAGTGCPATGQVLLNMFDPLEIE